MDQLEEVLSKIDIVQLINSYIQVKKAGRNFKALCPFHSEKTPSFIISPELQIFKCFGCGKGGNAVKFVAEYEKITFGQALRELAQKVGVRLTSYLPDKEEQLKNRLYQINHLTSEFYHYLLTKHKIGQPAQVYLLGRGISQESIRAFKLGYAPPGWRNLFNFLVGKKGYQQEEVEKAGLTIKSQRYYDRFRERIIFPISDHRGNIVGFSGRVINEPNPPSSRLNRDYGEAKYINSPETPIYHKSNTLYGLWQAREAIKKEDTVILVEGEFDVISSYQAGVANIVAIKGSALTKNQIELLARYTKNFNFCLDTDSAGQMAAYRGIDLAEEAGVNIKVINLPQGKDPDECVRTNPVSWHKAVKKPILIWDFYLGSAITRFGKTSGEAKKRITEEILPLFNKISNEVVKAHYLKKLAGQLEVQEEAVVAEAKRLQGREKVSFIKSPAPKLVAKINRKDRIEEYMLALVLHLPQDSVNIIKDLKTEYLDNPVIKRTFSALSQYLATNPTLVIEKFVKILPEELKETTQKLYLQDLQDLEDDKEKLIKEWQKTLKEVEKLYFRAKLGKLKKTLSVKTGNPEQKDEVEKELLKIIKKISKACS
jgi:DNA primase